jgi:hypothetical protein
MCSKETNSIKNAASEKESIFIVFVAWSNLLTRLENLPLCVLCPYFSKSWKASLIKTCSWHYGAQALT